MRLNFQLSLLNLFLQYSTKHEKVRRILKIFQKSLLYQPLFGTEPFIFIFCKSPYLMVSGMGTAFSDAFQQIYYHVFLLRAAI